MRFTTWIFATPVALIAIWIAVANRKAVLFSFDPFSQTAPAMAVEMPLYLLLFAAVLLGVLLGGFAIGFRRIVQRSAELAEVASEKAASLLPTRRRKTNTPPK